MKKIIAFILVFVMFMNIAPVAFAGVKETTYYIVPVEYSFNGADMGTYDITFMVKKGNNGAKDKLYVKAEDMSAISGADHFSYAQTTTEAAFTHAYKGNKNGEGVTKSYSCVIRYKFNSKNVTMQFAGETVQYTAPYESLYEDGVAWIPFQFAATLFDLDVSTAGYKIYVSAGKYNVYVLLNMLNENMDFWQFDWVEELERSKIGNWFHGQGAEIIIFLNQLFQTKISSWTSALTGIFSRNSLYADEGEMIAKSFITPSQQEIDNAGLDVSQYKQMSETMQFVDNSMESNLLDAKKLVEFINEKLPGLANSKSIKGLQTALKNSKFAKSANNLLTKYHKAMENRWIKGGMIGLDVLFGFVKVLEYYNIFYNKSDMATKSLKWYASSSDTTEADIFERYGNLDNMSFLNALEQAMIENFGTLIDKGVSYLTTWTPMIAMEVVSYGWDFVSKKWGYLSHGIDNAQMQIVSDRAVIYQNEAKEFYNRDREDLTFSPSQKKAQNLVKSLYANLKFAYIARDAAAATFLATAKGVENGDYKEFGKLSYEHVQECAEFLKRKNATVAEYLAVLEQDIYYPGESSSQLNDSELVLVIEIIGVDIDYVKQNEVPVTEVVIFPGENDPDILSKEDAEKLVRKTMNKYTGGMMNTLLKDLYKFSCIDTYVEGDKTYYVVQMFITGNPEEVFASLYGIEYESSGKTVEVADAMFMVPVDGSAVYLCEKTSANSYYHLEVDLKGFSVKDVVGGFSDLYAKLLEESGQ